MSMNRSACVEQKLGELAESIQNFKKVLEFDEKVLKLSKNFKCAYKCLGDCFSLLYHFPPTHIRIKLPRSFTSRDGDDDDDDGGGGVEVTEEAGLYTDDKLFLLELAERCYCSCLKLNSEASDVWYSLACSYYYQNAGAWSNLGFLYLINDKIELAHEAFKNAQSIEPSFANSWIGQALIAERLKDNLTVSHLESMDLFRHSVQIDNHPEAALSYAHWVCSTLDECNNINNNNNNNHNNNNNIDTKWLLYTFEHLKAVDAALDSMTKYLEERPDDYVGWNYFGLLCERKNLLITSCKAFERSLEMMNERDVDDGGESVRIVRTNYARLLCKTGQFELSLQHYNGLKDAKQQREQRHNNGEAAASAVDDDRHAIVTLCLHALCLYKNGQYDEAMIEYLRAKELVKDLRMEDLISVAMGIVCYAMGDNDHSQHFLLASIGAKRIPSIENLRSLLCLSVLIGQPILTKAVLSEMSKFKGQIVADATLCWLLCEATVVVNKSQDEGRLPFVCDLLRAIHLHPEKSEGWARSAMFLLQGHMTDDVMRNVQRFCEVALSNGDKNYSMVALQCLVMTSLLKPSKNNKLTSSSSSATKTSTTSSSFSLSSFRLAQKLVHMYPADSITNWSLLMHSCQKQLNNNNNNVNNNNNKVNNDDDVIGNDGGQWLKSFLERHTDHLIALVESVLKIDKSDKLLSKLHVWLSRVHIIATLLKNDVTQAKKLLNNALWLYEDDEFLQKLNERL
ncbi:hypothetical protein HELRODRAFT_194994 [Helobdella robusta]|uniref:Tetratricopeptide repeat protein 37 n=1 Tax=Helobdella robusta TaxID=6412 RepID=T1FWM8_HELRO|nr:hypothetical protein HELRODRAFT_194994 [Helobdella robusta]ESO09800.1 hypothetical protein HELRODRAFT_194994 [Helobdella robusta]